MIEKVRRQLLLGFLGLLLGADIAWSAHCCGFINGNEFSPPPSFLSPDRLVAFTHVIACYNLLDQSLVDCHFTIRIVGIVDEGGHVQHIEPHPLIEPKDASLQFDGIDKDPSKLGVEGQTEERKVVINHPLPQAAGAILTETIIDTPPRWQCANACFTPTSWKYLDTFQIGVKGLAPLPADGPFHVVVRGGMDTHPEGTSGTPETVETLEEIAQKYFVLTGGRKLSVNDLSLPKGGLFDYEATWAPPHSTHRTGTDADINRAGVDCNIDTKLRKAVAKVAERRPGVQLVCETAGRPDPNGPFKHIDFD